MKRRTEGQKRLQATDRKRPKQDLEEVAGAIDTRKSQEPAARGDMCRCSARGMGMRWLQVPQRNC